MLEQRNLKMDLLALGLLAVVVFLAASLLSYDPADPPSKLVFPERAEVLNACGRSGALVSRLLFTGLGLGAYYLLVSLAALDAVLLARRPVGPACAAHCRLAVVARRLHHPGGAWPRRNSRQGR